MKTATFDTTTKPNDPICESAKERGWHIAFVTVSVREAIGTDFHIALCKEDLISEVGVWDEPYWDEAGWADGNDECLENKLSIVSSNSFPKYHDKLSVGQLHQRRDAMILEAHVKAQRDVFITADEKAFVKNGKREELEALVCTKIFTPIEFQLIYL